MPHVKINLECPVFNSFRVQQVAGMFDVPLAEKLREQFSIDLPAWLVAGCSSLVTGHLSLVTSHFPLGTSESNGKEQMTNDKGQMTTDIPWQIGMIVGPSGSGKTTLARQLFGKQFIEHVDWPMDRAVIDCFEKLSLVPGHLSFVKGAKACKAQETKDQGQGTRDQRLSIHDITGLLTAVGFSSPPSWIKPYHVLSGGERFRCDLARALARSFVTGPLSLVTSPLSVKQSASSGNEPMTKDKGPMTKDQEPMTKDKGQMTMPLVAFDEFTSVVDRNVAQIGSAAVAKGIRGGKIGCRFVAVTCHYDILEWLEPDWIIDMATREFVHYDLAEDAERDGVRRRNEKERRKSEFGRRKQEEDANRHSNSPLHPFTPSPAHPRRRSLRRPQITLEIYRCHRSLWRMFARHHYLSGSLSTGARCYVAVWRKEEQRRKAEFGRRKEEQSMHDSRSPFPPFGPSPFPENSPAHLLTPSPAQADQHNSAFRLPNSALIAVAFCATLPVIGKKNHWRISRLVTLPDFQGIGIGLRVAEAVADLYLADGCRLNVTASHPSLVAHCRRSSKWRAVNLQKTGSRPQRGLGGYAGSMGRAVVSFEYQGLEDEGVKG
jgi:GNAT superfamily N-acetyltransferase